MEVLGVVIVVWVGGQMVMKGQMTLGSLVLFYSFIRSFFLPIVFLSAQFSEFQKGLAGAVRVFELLEMKSTIVEPTQTISIPSGLVSIEFKQVWFRYREEGEWVLRDVSFYCPVGQHWALVGPTGSGKTTIISLLLKFYQPQKGQILLNGVDIQHIPTLDLRKMVGLVLQDTILFPGTLLQNLVLDQNLTEEQVSDSMKLLGIHDIISHLPQQYETELLENATNLSAGERQLLSFGRAFLKNPSILLLDEATSNIDPQTERKIKEAMQTLLKRRTALIIAHRLSTIQYSDQILVLKFGQLIEVGTHQELLELQVFYS